MIFGMVLSSILAVQAAQGSGMTGRWDLTIRGPQSTFPGWLEVRSEGAALTGRLQWGWGHATPLRNISVAEGKFSFEWPNEDDAAAKPSRAEGRISLVPRRVLNATLVVGDGVTYSISGVPAPALETNPADTAAWGAPIDLLVGGLDGWRTRGDQNGWTLAGGILTNTMPSSDLITTRSFLNFRLHLEVEVPPGGNSGIYLRGRHEVQVLDSKGKPPGNREMGGIYGQVSPTVNAAGAPGEWQNFDITLVGRRVEVLLNGIKIIDFAEIPGITGGALDSEEAAPGPVMLQGDHTGIRYRNIRITPTERDTPVAREIRGFELRRFAAMMRGDTVALRTALAKELSYTHSNGMVETKAMHLSAVGSRRTVYEAIGPRGMSYQQAGDVVVGNGIVKSKGMLAGTAFDVLLRVTTVHIRRNGRWELLAWQSNRLP